MPDEYDDGYDCAASFEAAGADTQESLDEDQHWEDWKAAMQHFALDESFDYTRKQREGYIDLYLGAL